MTNLLFVFYLSLKKKMLQCITNEKNVIAKLRTIKNREFGRCRAESTDKGMRGPRLKEEGG